jgi:hypothetical protein
VGCERRDPEHVLTRETEWLACRDDDGDVRATPHDLIDER